MNRSQLEHLIRAAGSIVQDKDIIVIGSQAILGQFPNAPSSLLASVEADLFPKNFPERADLIDGSIGEASPFQQSFGYYAHGVGPDTAILPPGWKQRLIEVKNENTSGISGWCLEVHDLALAKCIAGREKDLNFVAELFKHGMINKEKLNQLLDTMSLDKELKKLVSARISKDTRS